MVAMTTKTAYTMKQLIDKAYTTILQTGLYETPCTEFRGMDPENQTYATLKEHMMQAFELQLQMGTVGAQNTAYNTYTNDNDLMGTIAELLANMQLTNKAAAVTINDNMSVITCKTTELRAIIEQMKQEHANNTYAPWQPMQPPQYTPIQPYTALSPYGMGPPQTAYTATTVPPYIGGPPPPPAQQPFQQLGQPTYQQNHGGQGRGQGRGRGDRGR